MLLQVSSGHQQIHTSINRRSVISTRHLTKFYGKSRGVIDLSLDVYEGEVFGFLGPNGAGKTTLIRTILDFIRPTGGAARIFGHDHRTHSLEIRKRVGYLPGEFSLYENMTGWQFLKFVASLRGGADWSYVKHLTGRLRCEDELERNIGDLSKGNKQKIGIIQAFMNRPPLLILDEPTSGLDPLMQQEVHRMIREATKRGATVFISSHILPEVQRVCDRFGIIREGKLATVGKVAQLKEIARRRVEMTFDRSPGTGPFLGVPGVSDIAAEKDMVRCTVQGAIGPLIRAAAAYDVIDFISHEPDLEEVFMTYYNGGV
ncbi:MAG: ABC transporter [Thermoplasmata archaeon HGW-Thermoplasmata-1]|nr:MAG: ABC transporter [Thermoplasmata archaeon HGW-Thermoplasmata-1]